MIYFFNKPQPHGGPGSFHTRFIEYLETTQISYTFNFNNFKSIDCALIVNGTNKVFHFLALLLTKKRVVFRVDGVATNTSYFRHPFTLLRAIYYDICTLFFLAFSDIVVFQSHFIESQWSFISPIFLHIVE